MAKAIRRKSGRRKTKDEPMPLGRDNFLIIGLGLVIITIGYLVMMEGSVEGVLPLVVAPILLVFGYCIVIPIGIIYRKKKKHGSDPAT